MNAAQFNRVFAAATSGATHETPRELQASTWAALSGIGLDRKNERRVATVAQCAYFLNYQCRQMAGQYDMDELNNTRASFRRVDLLD